MSDFQKTLKRSRLDSWERHGKKLTVYLPGMFSYNNMTGKYPAISITGNKCELQCDHCQAKILEPMINGQDPQILVKKALALADKGNHGILLSGGCDPEGRIPWAPYIHAIKEIKKQTDLYISVHCGLLDNDTALMLKQAGIDQALIDVIGDNNTFKKIYHVPFGISRIISSLKALDQAEIPIIPHIVCGLHFGRLKGENNALKILSRFNVGQIVIVALMTIPGTPLYGLDTPSAEEIIGIITEARSLMPDVPISLGCARKRGDTRLEMLAIDAGINRMALASEEAIKYAEDLGIEVRFQKTCCSVSRDFSRPEW